MGSEVEAGNFTTMVYSILLNAGKSELKMETLWKNSLIIAKDIHTTHVNFTVVPITLSEKKIGGIAFTTSCNYIKIIYLWFI
jgi:hypothetical protein